MRTIITARGVTEEVGRNIVAQTLRGLDPKEFRVIELEDFTASYGWVGGNEAFGISQDNGRQALIDAIRRDPYRVVLVGYSAGAKVVGDVAAEIADGLHPDLIVDLVILIADPARHPLQLTSVSDTEVGRVERHTGYGITGGRYINTNRFPVVQLSAPGDPISELPAGNPLRTLADLSEYWGPDLRRWIEELAKAAVKRQWQRWWSIENRRTWAGAAGWANNYLFGGRHTCYATEIMPGETVTYVEFARRRIAELA